MTNNLKPCPFCGNEEPSLNSPNEHYTPGSINCPACMVVFPGAVGGPHREQELIDNWNTRAPSPERASETTYKVGRWLSAALEDDAVCQEMKDDIIAWMEAGRPNDQTWPEREALGEGESKFDDPQFATSLEELEELIWSRAEILRLNVSLNRLRDQIADPETVTITRKRYEQYQRAEAELTLERKKLEDLLKGESK